MTLSEKRARSARKYLVDNGVAADRISYKGYGESKIINRCINGVECSDAEHEENRRTELTITGIREDDPTQWRSLKQIITEEEFRGNMFEGVIEIPEKPEKEPKK